MWVVYDYEVDMFKQTWNMVSMGVTNTFPHPIPKRYRRVDVAASPHPQRDIDLEGHPR
jgi:hypothetical protein